MDGWEFGTKIGEEVVQLLSSYAWPLVVGTLVLTQKKAISKAIGKLRLKHLKGPGGFAADFDLEEGFKELAVEAKVLKEQEASQIEAGKTAALGRVAPAAVAEPARVRVDTPPFARIEGDWSRLIDVLSYFLQDRGVYVHATGPGSAVIGEAEESKQLPPELIKTLWLLHRLRNYFVHDEDYRPTMEDAERFNVGVTSAISSIMFHTSSPVVGS